MSSKMSSGICSLAGKVEREFKRCEGYVQHSIGESQCKGIVPYQQLILRSQYRKTLYRGLFPFGSSVIGDSAS